MAKLILIFCVFIVIIVYSSARRNAPLKEGDFGSRSIKAAECQFGKQIRELGSTWFADLGPPFGVMYCIKCECIRIQKKKKIVAKVQCRNIKNECPKPSCDEPVLHPGRCCKTCPDDIDSPDLVQDIAPTLAPEEEERSMKHFAALLTGRTSVVSRRDDVLSPPIIHNSFNLIATGRFSFHKKNLYYSFYTTEESSPITIQFVDYEGNILEEQALNFRGRAITNSYRNATKKICGVWRRVPREYRRLLREEKMYVWLLWGGNDHLEQSLSGQIARYRTLNVESFSSLLQPSIGSDYIAMKGAGGMAIVSASTAAQSIHVSLVFNGVFAPDEIADVPITVRLEIPHKERVVLEEVVRVTKPSHELNIVEVQSPFTENDFESLTKGNLFISVSSKRSPQELRLEGRIISRTACEVFQTPLSSPDTPVSGLTWMYLNQEGSLVYNVQIDDLEKSAIPYITLVSGRGRQKLELEDLTPSFHSGWANGTIDMSAEELEQLYSGDLAVNVYIENEKSIVKGRLQNRLVADARDAITPVLFKRQNVSVMANLVGMAWLAVDSECSLHYDVMISGLEPDAYSLSLYLESVQFLAPGAPKTRRLLEEFQGNQLEGFVMGLTPTELLHIESGVSHVEIVENINNTVLLKARLVKVKIPHTCLPQFPDNDVPEDPLNQVLQDLPHVSLGHACYHGERFYEEGTQWRAKDDPCTMCHCQQGRVKCDIVPCPPLSCGADNITKAAPGQCCPTCNSSSLENSLNVSRGCTMAGQFYSGGSSWYPYLPPNGFMTCTICTCNASNSEVQCQRQQCPPLTCSDSEAFLPDKKACCKECPLVTQASILGDQPATTEDILAQGGCKFPGAGIYRNGDEWHPKVASQGEVKCVKCKCKDGNISCDRKRCNRALCSRLGKKRNNESVDECCPCRRQRRHHRIPTYS